MLWRHVRSFSLIFQHSFGKAFRSDSDRQVRGPREEARRIGSQGVNFMSILQAPLLYKSALRSFSLMNISAQATRKMLMKLTKDL